jgi:subtilisin family serine protease
MYKLKTILSTALFCGAFLHFASAQTATPPSAPVDPPKNWHQLDLDKDGFFGISLNQAYDFIKGKKSKPVLVATIDSGCDTLQKDMQGVIWVNPKDKGDGKDEDHDGYVNDTHGWDFLGGPGGKCDYTETTEEVREYARLKPKYESETTAPADGQKEYNYWLTVKATHDSTYKKDTSELKGLQQTLSVLMFTNGYIKKALQLGPNGTFTLNDLDKIQKGDTAKLNDTLKYAVLGWSYLLKLEGDSTTNVKLLKDINEEIQKNNNDVYPDLTSRKTIVGDDPNVWGSHYGNNIVEYPDAAHGTGVAGLIGAKRNNGYGIDGVADNVHIMIIKAVPNGDEYDKDIANAIRFAVDHGAKVVNMSFGKKLSPHKAWVDSAFEYAAAHDVLLVQAAGNDNQDVDVKPQFPNDIYLDGKTTDNVICVGASAWKKDTTLAGSFSNYGQKQVDLFAPGVKVTSIDLNAEFNTADGTSFASPIVTGVAALILEYYPKLSASQVKQAILESATPLKGLMVYKPGTHDLVDFTTLSKTGGIVNAYRALEIASKMKGERKRD